jgi:hypothetical protein
VKAAKTKAPIITAKAKAIRASKNLAIQTNAELAGLFVRLTPACCQTARTDREMRNFVNEVSGKLPTLSSFAAHRAILIGEEPSGPSTVTATSA